MYEFHKDKSVYFQYQYRTAKEYILPFVKEYMSKESNWDVMEVGCAEAGVLKAFTEAGHKCIGVELSESRAKMAREFMSKEIEQNQCKIISKNVFDITKEEDGIDRFDLIILKDVIEHIHGQSQFLKDMIPFLKPGGKIFFGFPPWMMPYGGHQQICKNKFASVLPYYHLFPKSIYNMMLKAFGESEKMIDDLLEIKETGISIERFYSIVRSNNYRICKKQLFVTNPIYKYKFNLPVIKQASIVSYIPFFRNFVSTCLYCIIEQNE